MPNKGTTKRTTFRFWRYLVKIGSSNMEKASIICTSIIIWKSATVMMEPERLRLVRKSIVMKRTVFPSSHKIVSIQRTVIRIRLAAGNICLSILIHCFCKSVRAVSGVLARFPLGSIPERF